MQVFESKQSAIDWVNANAVGDCSYLTRLNRVTYYWTAEMFRHTDGMGVMRRTCYPFTASEYKRIYGVRDMQACPYCGREFEANKMIPNHEITEFSDSIGAWVCLGSGGKNV